MSSVLNLRPTREGQIFQFKNGDKFKVVAYNTSKNVIVELKDKSTLNVYWRGIVQNLVSNPLELRKDGMTYRGNGHSTGFEINTKNIYDLWDNMSHRCFSTRYKEKYPTYNDYCLDGGWFNFQNFAEWCLSQQQYIRANTCLDKDLLVKDNKLYSSDTCCFIPNEINLALLTGTGARGNFFIGVRKDKKKFNAQISKFNTRINLGNFESEEKAFTAYKQSKEHYFKELAEKYKNTISEKAYNALITREITIDD